MRFLGGIACFVVILALNGCELLIPFHDQLHEFEENQWVGSWRLVSIDDEVFLDAEDEEGISVITNTWTFDADGTWWAKLVIAFDIEGPEQHLYAFGGRYWLDGANYTLFIEEGETFSEAAETTAGSWVLVGDTLILTGDEGEVLVLKKGGID